MKLPALLVLGAVCRAGAALRAAPADIAKAAADAERLVSKIAGRGKASQNVTQPHPRAKVDVGFAGFQQSVLAEVEREIRNSTKGVLSASLQERFVANFTAAFRAGLTKGLTPVKKAIGGTWMALPQDEQKDKFVSGVKSAFDPIFQTELGVVKSHLALALQRVGLDFHKADASQVDTATQVLSDSMLKDDCFDEPLEKVKAPKGKAPVKFCIDSIVNGLGKRLQDAQALLGMSERFEAGASMDGFSLAQKQGGAHQGAKVMKALFKKWGKE